MDERGLVRAIVEIRNLNDQERQVVEAFYANLNADEKAA